MQYLGAITSHRMILICFQGKQFNITVIQAYLSTTDAKVAEAEQLYEDL